MQYRTVTLRLSAALALAAAAALVGVAPATAASLSDPVISALQAKVTADDGALSDAFGSASAISGDTAIVGAPVDDATFSDQGSAYVYVRSGTTWMQQARLVATDPGAGDQFGFSVAIDGDTAVVGAFWDDGSFTDAGSAYVFTRVGTTWTQQAKLVAYDAEQSAEFGYSVAVSGDTVIVGADQDNDATYVDQGAAYVFTRSGGTWSLQQKFLGFPTAIGDLFGSSVAISGDTALIGARANDNGFSNSGAAFVFTRSNGSWLETGRLFASDAADNDLLGYSVSLSGDTALIGAPTKSGAYSAEGASYVFTRAGTTWTQQAKLAATNPSADDHFGLSVSVFGDTALIGAPTASGPGSAYTFIRSGAAWAQQARLVAPDAAGDDGFGWSVGLFGDTAIVGSHFDDVSFANQGSAYVFVPGAFSVSDAAVTEGTGGTTNATFTVTRTGTLAYSARVDVATRPGTATEGSDYDLTVATLTFNPGVASRSFTVPIVTDALHEDTELFGVALSNAQGAFIADGSGRGTINDDDATPTLSIASPAAVTETDASQVPATFTISRGGAAGGRISVEAHSFDGTAKAFDDYDPNGRTIVWADGDTADKSFTVMVEPDNLTEATERFGVRLSNAHGGADITTGTAKVAITDDDGAAAPGLSVNDPTVVEGAGGTTKVMAFKVTRSGSTASAITFNYATANGTAVAPGDYTAKTGTATIAAGATVATINVTIKGDAINETNEGLTFTISAPTGGATLTKAVGNGTITDDD